jgi:hypothetical protein
MWYIGKTETRDTWRSSRRGTRCCYRVHTVVTIAGGNVEAVPCDETDRTSEGMEEQQATYNNALEECELSVADLNGGSYEQGPVSEKQRPSRSRKV